jgi:hypothetical protein
MEMRRNLESSFNVMALNNLSIPTDKYGELQNEILDDELLLLSSLSWSFLCLPFLEALSEANLDFSEDDNDDDNDDDNNLMNFGALESLEVTDALDFCFSCLLLILDDFLGFAGCSGGHGRPP